MWAIKNATIYTVSNGIIKNGDVVIDDKGKIKEIGQRLDLSGMESVYEANEKPLTPGLIDVHTHLGIEEEIHPEGEDTNEMTNPLTPELRAIDGVNFFDIGFKDAIDGGVTTVMITMGSANVIGGVTTTVKTAGTSIDKQILSRVSGLKMAFGENPKRVYGKKNLSPQTRMSIMALARQAFQDALFYKTQRDKGLVGYDLGKENLLLALERKIPVRLHAHRADDLLQALELRDEFNLEMVLEHCTDAKRIAKVLKEKGAICAIGPAFVNRAKVEMENVSYDLGKALHEEGVVFSILTDHPVNPISYLSICVGMYIRHGLERTEALKAVTLNAAKILKLEKRLGSIEIGKDADLVVWSDEPFTINAQSELVCLDGRRYK